MPSPLDSKFDQEAARLIAIFPPGPRVAVIGSTSFWHEDSEQLCIRIGQLLAALPELTLITGGVDGVGKAVGRSFFQARREAKAEPRVFHVLPEGCVPWNYGITLFAGAHMEERREILGRVAKTYLMIEGGPGTQHEAEVAESHGALIVPLGRTGGHAGEYVRKNELPFEIDAPTLAALRSTKAAIDESAEAAVGVVRAAIACQDRTKSSD